MYSPKELMQMFPMFEKDLAEFLSRVGQIKVFEEGEMLMKTGQFFKSAVLIIHGHVKLYREGEEGNEFFMYYLDPGEACALSMICATRNQASSIMAIADEETEVVLIPIQFMDRLMRDYRCWYYFVL